MASPMANGRDTREGSAASSFTLTAEVKELKDRCDALEKEKDL